MSLCIEPYQKLVNALAAHPKLFDDLPSAHRSIEAFKQAPSAGAWCERVAPRSPRNGVEAAGFPARCRLPSRRLMTLRKPELSKLAKRCHSLGETEPRLHRDLG